MGFGILFGLFEEDRDHLFCKCAIVDAIWELLFKTVDVIHFKQGHH